MDRPTTAYVKLDPEFMGIRLAVVRRVHGATLVRTWTDAGWTEVDESTELDLGTWLQLDDDSARAVYEALAEHYGHGTNDVRALRRDHDAERARVDKLTDAVIAIASR